MRVFGRHMEFLAENFVAADEQGLKNLLAGRWERGKPGVIVSFDDGLVDNYRRAAPVLEANGLVGWFFISSGLPGLAPERQLEFCLDGTILRAAPPADDGDDRAAARRLGMDWDEIRDLAGRGHVIGCHTVSHRRFLAGADPAMIEAEMRGSRDTIRDELGRCPESFAWVGGERPETYAPEGLLAARRLGFGFAFTTKSFPILPGADPLALHRTMIDADTDFGVFRMKVAGISDLVHARQRRKIERAFAEAVSRQKPVSSEKTPEPPSAPAGIAIPGKEVPNVDR